MFKDIKIKEERLVFCFIVAFFWGMLAHGYAFFQNSFSHDSINYFILDNAAEEYRIGLGRIFQPLYRKLIRGEVTIPWLVGLLSILWCGFLIYVLIHFFEMKSKTSIFLMAGIIVTSRTATAWCATYMYKFDIILFGVFMASLAAYMWRRKKNGYLMGIPCIVIALGIYQSNISFAITMIMIISLLDLLEGVSCRDVIKKGSQAAVMLVGGGVVYALLLKIIWFIMKISPIEEGSNSLTNMLSIGETLLSRIKRTYAGVFLSLFNPVSIWPKLLLIGIVLLLGAITFILIVKLAKRNTLSIQTIMLSLVLIILLPVGMNVATFLAGEGHDLMYYAVWFVYFVGLILLEKMELCGTKDKIKRVKVMGMIVVILVGCILWNNVAVANTLYMKKDMEYDSQLSKMTRVVARIEEMEGYVEHVTPVAFIGLETDKQTVEAFKKYTAITGARLTTGITYNSLYEEYINEILNEDMVFCDEVTRQQLLTDSRVVNMPEFPAKDSIQMVDGIVVIKMGEEE